MEPAMPGNDAPVIVVSSDCHIGPRLVADLRPYCPSAHLDDFDGFVAQTQALRADIYNQWLADFCALAPARRVGLAQLPLWDIDAAISEVEWAHAHGLRGINFPAPRPGVPMYNDRAWERFWAVCAERHMTLTCHSG